MIIASFWYHTTWKETFKNFTLDAENNVFFSMFLVFPFGFWGGGGGHKMALGGGLRFWAWGVVPPRTPLVAHVCQTLAHLWLQHMVTIIDTN